MRQGSRRHRRRLAGLALLTGILTLVSATTAIASEAQAPTADDHRPTPTSTKPPRSTTTSKASTTSTSTTVPDTDPTTTTTVPDPTTTTTVPDPTTTSTTAPDPTTTTVDPGPTTTTQPTNETTATTAPDVSGDDTPPVSVLPQTVDQPGTLPQTGVDSNVLAVIGVTLILTGLTLVVSDRRRESSL